MTAFLNSSLADYKKKQLVVSVLIVRAVEFSQEQTPFYFYVLTL